MAERTIGKNIHGQPIFYGTAADLAAKTAILDALAEYRLDDGSRYQSNGAGGWDQTHAAGGAGLVTTAGFKPSSYTGKISSSEDGTTFAIATGATKLMLQSLDMAVAGTAEYAVVAFGTSAADAQANLTITGTTPNKIATTGAVVGSSTKVGEPPLILGIPANATHCAIGNGIAATVVQLMITQGT